MDVKKSWMLVSERSMSEAVMVQVQSRELLLRLVQSVVVKGQIVYTSAVFLWYCTECADLSGPVAVQVKVVKEKCPKCAGTGYTASKKEDQGILFQQELITDRVSVFAKKASRELMAVREEICL